MEPNKKLDLALSFYYKSFHDKNRKTHYEHTSDIVTNNPELRGNTSMDEAKLLADKLYKDEYIDGDDSNPYLHRINYDGTIFHLEGGYTQHLIDLESQRSKHRLHEKIIRVGAILAGLYAVVEIFSRICTFFAPSLSPCFSSCF